MLYVQRERERETEDRERCEVIAYPSKFAIEGGRSLAAGGGAAGGRMRLALLGPVSVEDLISGLLVYVFLVLLCLC